MPFNDQEIAEAGVAVLDHYVRNKPIDQVAVERVLMKSLMPSKSEVPAAKQYISEQLRDKYSSNFQWFNGAQLVTYNRRQTLAQTQFPWRSAHDGVAIDEDRLIQHGITVTDKGPGGQASGAEREVLTNLLSEQMASLRLGFEERFSKHLHLDGTSSTARHRWGAIRLDHGTYSASSVRMAFASRAGWANCPRIWRKTYSRCSVPILNVKNGWSAKGRARLKLRSIAGR